jgi:hypothetical protein
MGDATRKNVIAQDQKLEEEEKNDSPPLIKDGQIIPQECPALLEQTLQTLDDKFWVFSSELLFEKKDTKPQEEHFLFILTTFRIFDQLDSSQKKTLAVSCHSKTAQFEELFSVITSHLKLLPLEEKPIAQLLATIQTDPRFLAYFSQLKTLVAWILFNRSDLSEESRKRCKELMREKVAKSSEYDLKVLIMCFVPQKYDLIFQEVIPIKTLTCGILSLGHVNTLGQQHMFNRVLFYYANFLTQDKNAFCLFFQGLTLRDKREALFTSHELTRAIKLFFSLVHVDKQKQGGIYVTESELSCLCLDLGKKIRDCAEEDWYSPWMDPIVAIRIWEGIQKIAPRTPFEEEKTVFSYESCNQWMNSRNIEGFTLDQLFPFISKYEFRSEIESFFINYCHALENLIGKSSFMRELFKTADDQEKKALNNIFLQKKSLFAICVATILEKKINYQQTGLLPQELTEHLDFFQIDS